MEDGDPTGHDPEGALKGQKNNKEKAAAAKKGSTRKRPAAVMEQEPLEGWGHILTLNFGMLYHGEHALMLRESHHFFTIL